MVDREMLEAPSRASTDSLFADPDVQRRNVKEDPDEPVETVEEDESLLLPPLEFDQEKRENRPEFKYEHRGWIPKMTTTLDDVVKRSNEACDRVEATLNNPQRKAERQTVRELTARVRAKQIAKAEARKEEEKRELARIREEIRVREEALDRQGARERARAHEEAHTSERTRAGEEALTPAETRIVGSRTYRPTSVREETRVVGSRTYRPTSVREEARIGGLRTYKPTSLPENAPTREGVRARNEDRVFTIDSDDNTYETDLPFLNPVSDDEALSGRVSRMSLSQGDETRGMTPEELAKRPASQDSKFSKEHNIKKRLVGKGLEEVSERGEEVFEGLPQYEGSDDEVELASPKEKHPRRRSAFNVRSLARSTSKLLSLGRRASVTAGSSARRVGESSFTAASSSLALRHASSTTATADVGADHEEGSPADNAPPLEIPEKMTDVRVWSENMKDFVPIDDMLTASDPAYGEIMKVVERINGGQRMQGAFKQAKIDQRQLHEQANCVTCSWINFTREACVNGGASTADTSACSVCTLTKCNLPCGRLCVSSGSYFFGFLPLSPELRQGLSPSSKAYWVATKKARTSTSKADKPLTALRTTLSRNAKGRKSKAPVHS